MLFCVSCTRTCKWFCTSLIPKCFTRIVSSTFLEINNQRQVLVIKTILIIILCYALQLFPTSSTFQLRTIKTILMNIFWDLWLALPGVFNKTFPWRYYLYPAYFGPFVDHLFSIQMGDIIFISTLHHIKYCHKLWNEIQDQQVLITCHIFW